MNPDPAVVKNPVVVKFATEPGAVAAQLNQELWQLNEEVQGLDSLCKATKISGAASVAR